MIEVVTLQNLKRNCLKQIVDLLLLCPECDSGVGGQGKATRTLYCYLRLEGIVLKTMCFVSNLMGNKND